MQKFKKLNMFIAAGFMSLALAVAPVAAADTEVYVTEANKQGWVFNPDAANATGYEFTETEWSTGDGSLYVKPISDTAAHKFIAALPVNEAINDTQSISYDFLIGGTGTNDDTEKFYLNVYTNTPGSSTYYDCRFDYEPTTGSIDDFTTATFDASSTPAGVGDRTANGDTFTCPSTMAEMPEGSVINAITLNVGDTTNTDQGLEGYLDNVVLAVNNESRTYNFELNEPEQEPDYPTNKEECKDGGWEAGLENGTEFKNQGDCVSHFASDGKAKGNPVMNFFRSIFNR